MGKTLLKYLILSAVVSVAVSFALPGIRSLEILNLKLYDLISISGRGLLRSAAYEKSENIVIVAIDNKSLDNVGVKWPWPRTSIAGIVDKIESYNPSVLAIDLLFVGESPVPEEDNLLAETVKKYNNIFLASYMDKSGVYLTPAQTVMRGKQTMMGFVNKPRDPDNISRKMRPLIRSKSGDIIDYSMSLKTASYFMGISPDKIAREIELLEDGTTYTYPTAGSVHIKTISAWALLKEKLPADLFKNKIVLFGIASPVFHDEYSTPLGIKYGIELIAREAVAHLMKRYYRYPGAAWNAFILFVFLSLTFFAIIRKTVTAGIAINLPHWPYFTLYPSCCSKSLS